MTDTTDRIITREDCDHCPAYRYVSEGEFRPRLQAASFSQKGRQVHMGWAPAYLLDAMSDVPALPEDKAYDDLAKWMLQAPDAWQRPLDLDRIEDIGNFWANDENFIVNPAIVGVAPAVEVEITAVEGGIPGVIITFPNWFVDECPKGHTHDEGLRFDACPDHECEYHRGIPGASRPLQIIDGQHRIRGTQGGASPSDVDPRTEEEYAKDNLPFVLLRSDQMDSFDLTAQAKIFTEITTKGEELYSNHKIYLMYRFAQKGVVSNFDQVDMRPGTPDHKAYETCLRIISDEFGNTRTNPWRKKIPPLRGRQGVARVASLAFMFKNIRRLFRPGRAFDGALPYAAAKVIVAFGQAILLTWDRPSPQQHYYWYPPQTRIDGISEQSGIISTSGGGDNSTWLRILMDLLPDLIEATGKELPTRQEFMNALQPIKHCEFEGGGWEHIPGKEANENYASSILRDVISPSGPKKVADEMKKFGIADLNSYMDQEPLLSDPVLVWDDQVVTGDPPLVSGSIAVRVSVPFNIRGEIRIVTFQEGRIVQEISRPATHRGEEVDIRLDPGNHFDQSSGQLVTVNVTCGNPAGQKTKSIDFAIE